MSVRKRKNDVIVWIMVRRIFQSGESDYEGGFLKNFGGNEIFLVNSFAAAVAVAFFEGFACNFSS